MKRQAALVSLGLIAGLGLGYAMGVHRAPATGPAPMPEAKSAATAPRPVASSDRRTPGIQPAGDQAQPSLEEAKRQLADWVAAGAPEDVGADVFTCLETWSASDPQAALAFIVSAPRFPRRNFALAVPLAVIGRRDPNQVIAWLHANLPEQERGNVAEGVIRRICRENPREALVLAEADQTPVDRYAFGQILQQLARIAPAEAVAAFNRLSDGGREATAQAIASAWVASDPAAALRWVESLGGKPGESGARNAVISQLLGTDIDQALVCMRQWNLPEDEASMLIRMATHHNPEALLSRLDALSPTQRASVLGITLRQRFSSDPEQMVALTRASLPSDQAANLIGESWGRWLAEDRPAAEAWASTVQDSSIRSSIELAKLRDTANTDPRLFLSSIDNYPAALASEKPLILAALGQLNADVVASWIARHPGIVAPEYVSAAAAGYFEWNRDEALIWAHSLPPGNEQNQALASIAQQWTNTGDSAQAATTIAAITDQNIQTGTRFKVFTSLYRKDRAAATQWLAAQPVTPEIRANWETLATTITDNDSSSIVHLD
jgi:hypothetical protein